MEPAHAPRNGDESIYIALQEGFPDEVSQKAKHIMAAIPKLFEEAAEQIFRAAGIFARLVLWTVVKGAMKHVILDPIRTKGPAETVIKQCKP